WVLRRRRVLLRGNPRPARRARGGVRRGVPRAPAERVGAVVPRSRRPARGRRPGELAGRAHVLEPLRRRYEPRPAPRRRLRHRVEPPGARPDGPRRPPLRTRAPPLARGRRLPVVPEVRPLVAEQRRQPARLLVAAERL